MESIKKTRVAFVTNFSNSEVRSKLNLSKKSILYNVVRRVLLLPKKKKYGAGDLAPWISLYIKEFKKRNNIDLHVISVHSDMRCFYQKFEIDGVKYYFINNTISNAFKYLFKSEYIWKRMNLTNKIAHMFLKKINPDIIDCIGIEGGHFSLNIKNIPIYVSLQTIGIDKPTNGNRMLEKNIYVENEILKNEKYFGCIGANQSTPLRKINSKAIIFKHLFPVTVPEKDDLIKKIYDFVFFALDISPNKGADELLKASSIIKKTNPDIKINFVGKLNPNFSESFFEMIEKYDLINNITITPFFLKQSDMHKHIQKSRIAVLPIKYDIIPGTVIESMFLRIPVITNKTTGTPFLNSERECVLLNDIGDYESLAEKMKKLLREKDYAELLAENSYRFIKRKYNNSSFCDKLLDDYQAVINHFKNNEAISDSLLLNEKEIF
jgi:glycosyltransferase involved in cell wall biosynthesis